MDNLLDDLLNQPPYTPDPDSGDGIMRTNEQMQEWAEANNCTWEVADDYTLFIDIDSKEALATYDFNKGLADRIFDVDKRFPIITTSKSGGDKKHIRIKMKRPMTLQLRILLQACLGSDLRREMMSYKRALDGEENVVVFFEPKEPPVAN